MGESSCNNQGPVFHSCCVLVFFATTNYFPVGVSYLFFLFVFFSLLGFFLLCIGYLFMICDNASIFFIMMVMSLFF